MSDAYCSIKKFQKRGEFLAKITLNLINEKLESKENEILLFYLTLINLNLQNYEKTIALANKLIELNSNNPEYYYERGLVKGMLKDWQSDLEDQTKAIELNPSNPKYYYRRGLAKGWLKDWQGALKDYTKAIELNRSYTEAYVEKAKLTFEENSKKALNILLTALKYCKEEKDKIFTALSFVYFSQNDYKKALKYTNEAILFNRNNGTGYYRKYCALIALRKHDEAREFLEKANSLSYKETF